MKTASLRKPFSTAILAAGLLGVVAMSRCSFDEPSAPTWDLSLAVPLANRTYTMIDLADDTDEIVIDPLNRNLLFQHRQEIQSFEVGEYLRIDGGEDEVMMFLPPTAPVGWDTTLIGAVNMSDAILVDSAEISRGYVDFWASNPTGHNVRVEVAVPSLTRSGEPLPIVMNVQQGSSYQRTWLDSALLTLNGTNVVDYAAKIKVIGGDNGLGGVVDLRVAVSDIHFKTVTGTLDHLMMDLDTTRTELDIPEEMEGFRAQNAYLRLSMMLGYIIPVDLHLVMEGLGGENAGTRIALDATFTPTSRTDTTVVDMGDVAELLNSRPQRILTYGTLELGDGESPETLRDTDRVGGTALIEAPFVFSLPADTTEVHPEALDIEKDDREKIRDNLFHAGIEAEVGNHLPFGATVTFLFDTTRVDSTLYDEGYTPNLTVGPLELSPAPVEGDPGLVTEEVVSRLLVDLDKDDLTIFESERLHMGTRIVILGTRGRMVKIRPSDYLNVRANLRAQVRTDF